MNTLRIILMNTLRIGLVSISDRASSGVYQDKGIQRRLSG